MKVAVAQIAPVLLDRAKTIRKITARIEEAAAGGAALVAFGEALVPGYPAWLSRTHGSRFDDPEQKAMHARYLEQGVDLEAGDLDEVRAAAKRHGITVVVGVMERPRDRGGHTLYCTCVVIDAAGAVASAHRKLMPTYEERLAWGMGDGAGLVVHEVGPFTMGALNCWENWMPLARAALYGLGENLHVAIWPGSVRNTVDITRFIALESRSFVISAAGLLRPQDIPPGLPLRDAIVAGDPAFLQDGGSAIAAPDGTWLLEPVAEEETVHVVDLDLQRVREERQNFDPAGHYARPDVLRLAVNRERQRTIEVRGDAAG